MKLHTETYSGNLHQAATAINKQGLAEYVIVMDFTDLYTVVVFKMPDELVYKLREENRNYAAHPHHDDPIN